MTTSVSTERDVDIVYPETDGEPLGENTLQYLWIVMIHGNIDLLYHDVDDVCVFADLFWYAVQGQPGIRTAPDTMVVFGRPKGHRSSYLQWLEGNIAPQVVFEVQSPGNTAEELQRRFDFYQQYGVEEYYLWYPQEGSLSGWLRSDGQLVAIAAMHGHVSPRLGIRFDLASGDLVIYRPDGQPFLTFAELATLREEAQKAYEQAEQARQQAERDRELAEREREQAERNRELAEQAAKKAREEADRLREKLRVLGIDPDA